MRGLLVVVSVAITAGAMLSGCSVNASVGGGGLTVSATDLQNDISSKLEKAGQKPKSVTCPNDLKGEVGASTDCTIVITDDNTIQGHVTATKVDGTTVSYETAPGLSQEQLETQVSNFVEQNNNVEVSSVSCESGLVGVKGKTADCTVDLGGDPRKTVVTVTKVDGLLMDFDIEET